MCLLLSLFILVAGFCHAEIPEHSQATPPAQAEKFISWSWDFPAEYESRYAITEYSYWRGVADTFCGGFRYLHLRTDDDGDEFHISGYASLRPAVIHFGNVFMSLGGFIGFNSFEAEFNYYNLSALNAKNKVKRKGIPVAAGFSMLLSLPEQGIQMTFEVGHLWRRITADVDDVVVAPIPGFPTGKLHRNQKDSGINLFYEVSFLSERELFTGITLNVVASYITGPKTVDEYIDHPLLGKIQRDGGIERGSFVVGNVYLKLVSMPLPQFMSFLPKKPMVTVEPGFAVAHFSSDDGYGVSTGVRLSIMDAVRMYYFHNFDRKNDEPDSDVFAIEVGFKLGRGTTANNL